MAIQIGTGYGHGIEVGTQSDFRSMADDCLYVRVPADLHRLTTEGRVVLTQTEALDLASVLLRTVKVLMLDADQPTWSQQRSRPPDAPRAVAATRSMNE